MRCLIAGLLGVCCMTGAWSQGYPQKPVRIILPYLGGTEFAGRWLAAKLSTAFGQQVIVDPRPGAGGKIGHELLVKSPPDGYTLMLGAPPVVINPHRQVSVPPGPNAQDALLTALIEAQPG